MRRQLDHAGNGDGPTRLRTAADSIDRRTLKTTPANHPE